LALTMVVLYFNVDTSYIKGITAMMNPDHKIGYLSNRDMSICDALEAAFISLNASGTRENHDAATIIKAIYDQRGLDDGSGDTPDRLTAFMNECIFG
jgi:hypothetical protein